MGTTTSPLVVATSPGNTVNWYNENQILLSGAPIVSTNSAKTFIFFVSQVNSFKCEGPKTKQIVIVKQTPKIVSSTYTNPTSCDLPTGSITLNILDLNDLPISNVPVKIYYSKFNVPFSFETNTDNYGNLIIPLSAGNYSQFYVEVNGCFSQKIPDIFILKDPNPPAKPVTSNNSPLCSGNDLILTAISATSSQFGTINYIWVGPAFGPYADTVSTNLITFQNAPISYQGTYTVYSIQNNCISETTSFNVKINQSPSVPEIATKTPLCIGENLSLQAYSVIPDGTPLTYTWNGPGNLFPANTSFVRVDNVDVENSGVYSITVTSPQNGCSSSNDTLVEVGGFPIIKFDHDSLTLPTGYRLNLGTTVTNSSEKTFYLL